MVLGTVTCSLSFWAVFNAIDDSRSSNSLDPCMTLCAQICSAVTLLGSFQSDSWQPWLSKKDPVQQPSLFCAGQIWLTLTELYRQYHRTSSRPRSCTQLWVFVHDQVSMSQQEEDQSSCSLRFSVPCECILLHNRGLTGLGGPLWKCLAFQQMSLHTFLGEHCNTLLQPVVLWEYLMFLSASLFLLILKH